MNPAIDPGRQGAPYQVPQEPGRWRAITLAAVVHAALVAFLWIGIRWQSETPVAVEAEVWSPQAKQAAPRAAMPPPEPVPEPAPAPVLKPQPAPTPAPPKVETPPEKAPDIALEQERKRLLLQKAREQELAEQRKEAERARADDERRRKALAQKAEQQAEQRAAKRAELVAEQQAAQKRAAQDAANQKRLAEAEQAKKADALKKQEAARKKQEALQEQQAKAAHDANVRRLTEMAGAATASPAGPTGSGGSGDAARSQGSRADASYTQKVGAKIRSNTIFNGAEELTSNPSVEIAVELLPDGSIRRQHKIKPSGIPGFDEAVARAIEKSQPFPPDKSGKVPSGFTVSHRPKDQ